MSVVEKAIETAREELLDLSLRNRLLNFREYSRSTAKIIGEIPMEVYGRLVLEGKHMRFKDLSKIHEELSENNYIKKDEAIRIDNEEMYCNLCEEGGQEKEDQYTSASYDRIKKHVKKTHQYIIIDEKKKSNLVRMFEKLEDLPPIEGDFSEKHTDKYLRTSHEEDDLEKRLFHINKKANALIEDAGYNALYVALGFLHWKEASQSDSVNRAPLVLIPVEFSSEGTHSSFKIRWNEEEVISNLSLKQRLDEQGIDMPDFDTFDEEDTKEVIRKYLLEVGSLANDIKGWKVTPSIHLGFFDFTKFIMYQDLDKDSWSEGTEPAKHHLIKTLLDPDEEPQEPSRFSKEKIDKHLHPSDTYHVLDADPSQIAVIEEVKKGRDLVVEGPPGTGKSQTIVNVISELLAKGKSVLFVSEKMAALDVVKERLDDVGVGNFCVNLHSEESKKSKFLKELERLTKLKGSHRKLSAEASETFNELEQKKRELNNYAEALRKEIEAIELTPFDLFGVKEKALRHFEEKGEKFPYVDLEGVSRIDREEFNETKKIFENLSLRLKPVQPIDTHPWCGCNPGEIFPKDKSQIGNDITYCINHLKKLQEEIKNLIDFVGLSKVDSFENIQDAINATRLIAQINSEEMGLLSNSEWSDSDAPIHELVEKFTQFKEIECEIEDRIHIEKLHGDLDKWLNDIRDIYDRLPVELNKEDFKRKIEEFSAELNKSFEYIQLLEKRLDELKESTGVAYPTTWGDIDDTLRAAKIIRDSKPTGKEILSSSVWNKIPDDAKLYIKKIKNFHNQKSKVEDFFNIELIHKPPLNIAKEYKQLKSQSFRFFYFSWWKIKRKVNQIYKDAPPKTYKLLRDFKKAQKLWDMRENLKEIEEEAKKLFGSQWKGPNTKPKNIKEFALWMKRFRSQLNYGALTERSIKIVQKGVNNSKINRLLKDVKKCANKTRKKMLEILSSVTNFSNEDKFKTEFLNIPIERIKKWFDNWRSLINDWNRLENKISSIYKIHLPNNFYKVVKDLEKSIKYHHLKVEIDEAKSLGEKFFGSYWKGSESNREITTLSERLTKISEYMEEGILKNRAITKVEKGFHQSDQSDRLERIANKREKVKQKLQKLFNRIGTDAKKIFGKRLCEVSFRKIHNLLEKWRNSLDRLSEWSQFQESMSKCKETFASSIVNEINEGKLEPDDIIPCFKGNYAENMLKTVFKRRKFLSSFNRNSQSNRIEKFENLDEKSIQINQKRVVEKLKKQIPPLFRDGPKDSPASLLVHEFGKSKRHLPIRKLINKAGNLILKMKPCFMMSPLSVAKYLEPGTINFDVVIFDEASQVKPEDALSPILRGDQLVIFGDSKQLPPTSFFEHTVEEKQEQDPEKELQRRVADSESILSLCRSKFPTRRLKWHYRSRHESLIAVSNSEFYNNELLIYPSPRQEDENLGLNFRHLADTSYDRGGSSVNQKEARKVAEACVEHFQNYPDKSLGVGTFSRAQQEAIEEEILRIRKENKEIDPHFSKNKFEPFFVKNLERIQGDERDVIYISVGYGYGPEGGFSHYFGPINKKNGWRRLNVLITRARERCEIFANFTSHTLKVNQNSPRGLRVLKTFLKYAETGQLGHPQQVRKDPESAFEESVLEFLRSEDIKAEPQVGSAGYRIDIGIVDPEYPGRYILGIECDGAPYHSTKVARARDRLRQQVLEDRGWKIYRIWSTDWYRNRERAKERLVHEVQKAKRSQGTKKTFRDDSKKSEIDSQKAKTQNFMRLDSDDGSNFKSLEELVDPYKKATSYGPVQLRNGSPTALITKIKKITKQEGPIHKETLFKRLRDASNVKKIGSNIRKKIEIAIDKAISSGSVEKKKDFIWPVDLEVPPVRKRTGEISANIDKISVEEISEGIKLILRTHYSASEKELIRSTAKLLGFDRTSKKTSKKLHNIINEMIKKEIVEEKESGEISLLKQ